MNQIPSSGEFTWAIDPMATSDHILSLLDVMNNAVKLLDPLGQYVNKRGVSSLRTSDAEVLAEMFVEAMGKKVDMLAPMVLQERIEHMVHTELIVGRNLNNLFNHLYGLAIALSLSPYPRVSRSTFFSNGVGEA